MSFYRIYRPKVFDEIDNQKVRDVLLSLLKKDKKDLPHAFLFTGSRGTGKTTAARLVAKLLTCKKVSKTTGPCGTCESCKMISEARHLDVLELDAASNRGIDEIRTLRDGIALTPVLSDYKVYIIDEVHMLTIEAFNALLKTLEEPPSHAVFILATTDPQKLPKTIISRCMVVSFSQANITELLHALGRIAKVEKLPIDNESLGLIAKAADGSFRDAVKYLEQVSFLGQPLTSDAVLKVLSMSSEGAIDEFLRLLSTRDLKSAIQFIGKLVNVGSDMKTFCVELLRNLEQKLLAYVEGKNDDILKVNDIKDLINRLTKAYSEMKLTPIPELPLELAVVEFCEHESEKLEVINKKEENPQEQKVEEKNVQQISTHTRVGDLTLEHLTECWKDVIEDCKSFNHSIAGVLRSARPKDVSHGIVTLEAFYTFHREKLSEIKTKEMLSSVFKKLFGENVKVEIVLGKK